MERVDAIFVVEFISAGLRSVAARAEIEREIGACGVRKAHEVAQALEAEFKMAFADLPKE